MIRLKAANAAQTLSSAPSGNDWCTMRAANRMVMTCPATAPQRSRTIQRRLIREADSTVGGITSSRRTTISHGRGARWTCSGLWA